MMRIVLYVLGFYLAAMLLVSGISSIFSPIPEEPKTAHFASFGESDGEEAQTEQTETAEIERTEAKTEESPFDFSVNVITEAEEETAVEYQTINPIHIHKTIPQDLAAVMIEETERRKRNHKKGGVIMPAVLRLKDKDGNIWTIPAIRGEKGSSIQSIERTDGDGSAGTTDTYTLTMSGGETFTFYVKNGADGKTHKAGKHILLGEDDTISVDMCDNVSDDTDDRPIAANQVLALLKLLAQGNEDTYQKKSDAVKMTIDSYTGNGNFGAENPVILTFDFVPKFVIVAKSSSGEGNFLIWIAGLGAMLQTIDVYDAHKIYASAVENTLSFYNTTDAANGYNESGTVYHYFALG